LRFSDSNTQYAVSRCLSRAFRNFTLGWRSGDFGRVAACEWPLALGPCLIKHCLQSDWTFNCQSRASVSASFFKICRYSESGVRRPGTTVISSPSEPLTMSGQKGPGRFMRPLAQPYRSVDIWIIIGRCLVEAIFISQSLWPAAGGRPAGSRTKRRGQLENLR
jgi:hypothetical protein